MTYEELRRTQQERLNNATREVLRNSQSRVFLLWLLEQCGIYETTYDANPQVSAFKEGRRNLGLQIISQFAEVDPRAYAGLLSEQADRNVADAMTLTEPDDDAD